MGRTYWNKKQTVENCLDINIIWLKKHGYLAQSKSGGISWTNNWGNRRSINISTFLGRFSFLQLSYSSNMGGVTESLKYEVQLLSTPCNYGGERFWFHCPLIHNGNNCRHRVTTLYLPSNSKYFGCRHCHELTYESRSLGRGHLRIFRDTYTYVAKLEAMGNDFKESYSGKITKKLQRRNKLLQQCRESTKALALRNGLFL